MWMIREGEGGIPKITPKLSLKGRAAERGVCVEGCPRWRRLHKALESTNCKRGARNNRQAGLETIGGAQRKMKMQGPLFKKTEEFQSTWTGLTLMMPVAWRTGQPLCSKRFEARSGQ